MTGASSAFPLSPSSVAERLAVSSLDGYPNEEKQEIGPLPSTTDAAEYPRTPKPYKSSKNTTNNSSSKYGPLRLKVAQKDESRVVISLANDKKILVQVQIDQSVLKYKGVHTAGSINKKGSKTNKTAVSKTPTIKKRSSHVPSSKELLHQKMLVASLEPRPLPDEHTPRRDNVGSLSHHRSRRSRSNSREPPLQRSKTTPDQIYTDDNATQLSEIPSLAHTPIPSSSIAHDEDTTRSPKSLWRINPFSMTPRGSKKKTTGKAKEDDGEATDQPLSPTATKEMQLQKAEQQQQQQQHLSSTTAYNSSLLMNLSDPTQQIGHIRKLDEEDDISALSTIVSQDDLTTATPVQQRRLLQRAKRFQQMTSSQHDSFRTTRSARSGNSNSQDADHNKKEASDNYNDPTDNTEERGGIKSDDHKLKAAETTRGANKTTAAATTTTSKGKNNNKDNTTSATAITTTTHRKKKTVTTTTTTTTARSNTNNKKPSSAAKGNNNSTDRPTSRGCKTKPTGTLDVSDPMDRRIDDSHNDRRRRERRSKSRERDGARPTTTRGGTRSTGRTRSSSRERDAEGRRPMSRTRPSSRRDLLLVGGEKEDRIAGTKTTRNVDKKKARKKRPVVVVDDRDMDVLPRKASSRASLKAQPSIRTVFSKSSANNGQTNKNSDDKKDDDDNATNVLMASTENAKWVSKLRDKVLFKRNKKHPKDQGEGEEDHH